MFEEVIISMCKLFASAEFSFSDNESTFLTGKGALLSIQIRFVKKIKFI